MSYDLGCIREELSKHGAGPMPLSKEVIAALQSGIVGLGAFARFYVNEMRWSNAQPKKGDRNASPVVLLGATSFLGACALFGLGIYGLLHDLGMPSDFDEEALQADALALYVLVLVWCGYPIVQILARACNYGRPDDDYSPSASLFKDFAFGALDIASKCGLAAYVAMRAFWCPAACEAGIYTHSGQN